MKRAWTTLRALVYTTLFVWLWGWLSALARPYDHLLGGATGLDAHGRLGVIVSGAVLAASCVTVFIVGGEGTAAPFDAPRRFVAVGPYRYVRNPMYLTAFLILVGFGLVQRSPAMALFAIPWLAVVHLAVVLLEEPDLERKFGASYDDYRRAVSRWLPSRPTAAKARPGF